MKISNQHGSCTMNELDVYWEINHENIVKYFDHFNARSHNFLIIEYCEVSK